MALSYIQANSNGRLHPADEPAVPPLNRGYLYGDAVYEVWRTHAGVLFAFAEHWARLERSASALHLALPLTPASCREEIARTAAAFRTRTGESGELYVRLQVTRGAGPIGLDPGLADRPDWTLLVQRAPAPVSRALRLAIPLGLRRNPADCLNPAWKTGNYLNNLLGVGEARRRGAADALFLNQAGHLTEVSAASLVVVEGTRLVTPRLEDGLLAGITRALLLTQVAPAVGLAVEERSILPSELDRFSEAMVLSTTKDVAPVASIDGHEWPEAPGPVTRRLIAGWQEWVGGYARQNPGLRV
ncbi:MAG: aminotransferase class IV [Verrucomicrobia bacterium]|nr:aminotransferase class IV [Verrucomicrobiota bacterium]